MEDSTKDSTKDSRLVCFPYDETTTNPARGRDDDPTLALTTPTTTGDTDDDDDGKHRREFAFVRADRRTDGPTERLRPTRSVRPVTERLFRVKINQPTDPWRNRIARVASTKTRESDSFDFAGSRGRESGRVSVVRAFVVRDARRGAERVVRSFGGASTGKTRRRREPALSNSRSGFTLFRARYFHLHFVSPHQLCVTVLSG